MKNAAIPKVDFGGLYLTFFYIGEIWLELPYHESRGQYVKVAPNSSIGRSKRPGKLRSVEDIRVIDSLVAISDILIDYRIVRD